MGSLSEADYIVHNNNNEEKEQLKKVSDSELKPENSEHNKNEPEILLPSLQNRICTNLHAIISELESPNYKKVIGLIEQLAFYQICKAFFIELKWNPKVDDQIVFNDFIKQYRLNRHFKKLILTLLRRLAERGILVETRKNKAFKVIEEPPSTATIKEEIKNIQTEVLEYPAFVQEFSCTEYFGAHLASVLTEKETGLNVLFPDEKDVLKYPFAAKTFYQNSYIMKQSKVIPTIAGMIEHIKYLMAKNPGQSIKILEIGGGTGGTTIPLLKSLKPQDLLKNLEYTFTDISNFFVSNTKCIILSQFPELTDTMEFKLLDIENHPGDQGFDTKSFDIILAADVFHATEFLTDTVDHTRSLLKDGGLLILGEVFNSTMFLEISFGLTTGWWRWGDKIRKHFSPLLPPNEWNELLKEHGFLDSFSIGDDNYGIIFAQAN